VRFARARIGACRNRQMAGWLRVRHVCPVVSLC
jgi:hypothetical protein